MLNNKENKIEHKCEGCFVEIDNSCYGQLKRLFGAFNLSSYALPLLDDLLSHQKQEWKENLIK